MLSYSNLVNILNLELIHVKTAASFLWGFWGAFTDLS